MKKTYQKTIKLNQEAEESVNAFINSFEKRIGVRLKYSQAIMKLVKHFNGETEA